jgi:hypothetical protein
VVELVPLACSARAAPPHSSRRRPPLPLELVRVAEAVVEIVGVAELVDAAFDVAVAWNNWHHVLRDASWRQKYGLNVRLAGNGGRVQDGAHTVTTTPTPSKPDRGFVPAAALAGF